LDDPYILLHERKLSNLQSMLPILEAVVQSGHSLLIVTEDVKAKPSRRWSLISCAAVSRLPP
jgi:chaperonin GroEL